jgi:hypothetical protein
VAAGCYGMSAIVALTAQSTVGVSAVHEVPPEFVRAQLEAVFGDIGVDAAEEPECCSRRRSSRPWRIFSPSTLCRSWSTR